MLWRLEIALAKAHEMPLIRLGETRFEDSRVVGVDETAEGEETG